MSKEYKRDKTKSMVDLCVAISIANENCEGENWGDAINLCGEADILIKQYEATITALEAELAKHEAKTKRSKGTSLCMDCGKIIKTIEQSKHDKECEKKPTAPASKLSSKKNPVSGLHLKMYPCGGDKPASKLRPGTNPEPSGEGVGKQWQIKN